VGHIVAGARAEMADAFIGYTTWCKARSLRPMVVAEFLEEMKALYKQFGIRIHTEGDRDYLLNVRLVDLTGSERLGPMGREKRS
jgi:hypothetical protein